MNEESNKPYVTIDAVLQALVQSKQQDVSHESIDKLTRQIKRLQAFIVTAGLVLIFKEELIQFISDLAKTM